MPADGEATQPAAEQPEAAESATGKNKRQRKAAKVTEGGRDKKLSALDAAAIPDAVRVEKSRHWLSTLWHRAPKVDAVVLGFALGETCSPADFVIRSDGTVRLAPQLARRVCQIATSPGRGVNPGCWVQPIDCL